MKAPGQGLLFDTFTRSGDSIVPPTPAELERRARAARDDGMQRAADHADAESPSWSDVAFAYFSAFARQRAEFMTEAARSYAEGRGLPLPPDKRAWGVVAMRAARAGIVTKAGYCAAADPKVHKSIGTLWRSNVGPK